MIRSLFPFLYSPAYGRFLGFCRVLSLALTIYILAPRVLTQAPTSGLDPSYQIGLLHALLNHLTFGTEYIFTYGPLAFSMTRVAPASLHWGIVLFDAAMLLGLGHMIWRLLNSLPSVLTCIAVPAAAVPLTGDIYFYQAVIVWFALLGFYLLLFLEARRIPSLLAAAAISIVMLYLKLNFGLVTVPLMAIFLLHCLVVEKRRPLFGVLFVGYLAALLGSAFALEVSLREYLISGWHLADSFNDAMYLDPFVFNHAQQLWQALTVIGFIVLLFLLHLKSVFTKREVFVMTGFTALFVYLLFKQAFVRADEHVILFAQFAPLTLLPLVCFSRRFLKAGATVILLGACGLSAYQGAARYTPAFAEDQWAGLQRYLAAVPHPAEPDFSNIPAIAYLPADLHAIIGNSSIDIMPWESSLAYFHNLNYDPRPIFQTYQAYDPYLDARNAEFFRSGRAPRFVLFHPGCIDDRYCFGDEFETKLALLERYDVRAKSDPYLLLEKRAEPLAVERVQAESGAPPVRQRFKIPDSAALQLLHLDVRYTTLGKLRRLFFQPPRVNMRFRLDSGEALAFRGIVPILRGGLVANRFVFDLDSAESFFSRRFENLPKIANVSLDLTSRNGLMRAVEYRQETLAVPAEGAAPR